MISREIVKKNFIFILLKCLVLILFIVLIAILNIQALADIERASEVKKGVPRIDYEYKLIFNNEIEEITELTMEIKTKVINEISKIKNITLMYRLIFDNDNIMFINDAYRKQYDIVDIEGNQLKNDCVYQKNGNQSTQFMYYNKKLDVCGELKKRDIFLTERGKVSTEQVAIYVVDPFWQDDGSNGYYSFGGTAFSFIFDVNIDYTKDELMNLVKATESEINGILRRNNTGLKVIISNVSNGYNSINRYLSESIKPVLIESELLVSLLIIYLVLSTYYMRIRNLRFYSICISQGKSRIGIIGSEIIVNVGIYVIAIMLVTQILKYLNVLIIYEIQIFELVILLFAQILFSSVSILSITKKEVIEQCSTRKG